MKTLKTMNMAFAMLTVTAAMAQQTSVNISFKDAGTTTSTTAYIKPMDIGRQHEPVALDIDTIEGMGKATVETSRTGLYQLIIIRNQSQTFLPVSITPSGDKHEDIIPLHFTENGPMTEGTDDNRALSAFSAHVFTTDRKLWTQKDATWDDYQHMTGSYSLAADSILNLYRCSETVEQYIRLWACTSAYNSYSSLPAITGKHPLDIPIKFATVAGNCQEALDTPLASLFPIANAMIIHSTPKDTDIATKIDYIYTNYSCAEIRNSTVAAMLNDYIAKFNYQHNYEQGLALLTKATEKHHLDHKYLDTFIANRVTIKGAPLPEGLSFLDADGNRHTMEEFRGKYVYIDFWASWCVPCCREVPHLQKLEAELNNDNVVFLSISIDKTETPWRKKMAELSMYGNQWIDSSNTFANALNVRGIPFFVIYDKEGKLFLYNAPRPSTGEKLKALLENLE